MLLSKQPHLQSIYGFPNGTQLEFDTLFAPQVVPVIGTPLPGETYDQNPCDDTVTMRNATVISLLMSLQEESVIETNLRVAVIDSARATSSNMIALPFGDNLESLTTISRGARLWCRKDVPFSFRHFPEIPESTMQQQQQQQQQHLFMLDACCTLRTLLDEGALDHALDLICPKGEPSIFSVTMNFRHKLHLKKTGSYSKETHATLKAFANSFKRGKRPPYVTKDGFEADRNIEDRKHYAQQLIGFLMQRRGQHYVDLHSQYDGAMYLVTFVVWKSDAESEAFTRWRTEVPPPWDISLFPHLEKTLRQAGFDVEDDGFPIQHTTWLAWWLHPSTLKKLWHEGAAPILGRWLTYNKQPQGQTVYNRIQSFADELDRQVVAHCFSYLERLHAALMTRYLGPDFQWILAPLPPSSKPYVVIGDNPLVKVHQQKDCAAIKAAQTRNIKPIELVSVGEDAPNPHCGICFRQSKKRTAPISSTRPKKKTRKLLVYYRCRRWAHSDPECDHNEGGIRKHELISKGDIDYYRIWYCTKCAIRHR